MQTNRYPKLGTTKRLYPRDQFGRAKRHTAVVCEACVREALHRVVVQTSWFRGEDDVFLLCGSHKDVAVSGDFAALYRDIKNANK